MFSKLLNLKNLIFGLLLVLVIGVLVSPNFLKQTTPKKVTSPKTSNQAKPAETVSQNPESTHPDSLSQTPTDTNKQVQGTSTQKSSSSKTKSSPTNPNSAEENSDTAPISTGPTNEAGQPVPHQVTLNIDNNSVLGTDNSFRVDWTAGMSVYDVLSKASVQNSFSLVAKMYPAPLNSYYVTGLDGHTCECWLFKINNTCLSVGVSNQLVNENDTIFASINNICS